MGFEKPQDYVVALKNLEGFPLMGIEVRDGRLVFASLSRQVSLPLHEVRGGGYKVDRYGLNKLDVLVSDVEYNDQSGCVRLLDENGDVTAHVKLKNVTRAEQLFSELHGRSLRGSLTVNVYKKYVRLADGVVFTEEADGLAGVLVQWRFIDLPVDRINDWGNKVSIMTEEGAAVEILFRKEDSNELMQRAFDATGVFFDNGAAVAFDKSEYRIVGDSEEGKLASMARVNRLDGSDAWRLIDDDGRTVITVELAQPTDPLPVYVTALKEALIGSRVQSVSVSDGGLCLHLDDDYDAVTNGALRVRVDAERVPFTVGDVLVNRGGAGPTLCLCAHTENKPVVTFKIDQNTLERREIKFNVI